MNRLFQKIYISSFVLLILLSSCYNRQGELLLDPNVTDKDAIGTTFFPGNELEVIARVVDDRYNTFWVYGQRQPFKAMAATYTPTGRNLRFHFLFDDQGRLEYVFASYNNGERLPDVLRITYTAGVTCYLSRYTTDWAGSFQLEWQVEVNKSTAAVLPVFVRDECADLRAVAQHLENGLALMAITLEAVVLPLPSWLGTVFIADLGNAIQLLENVCEASPVFAGEGPSAATTPGNPARQRALLNSNTGDQPCAGGSAITFRVERNDAGSVIFKNVEGGNGPYRYAFNGSPFQDDPAFTGPFEAGRPFLMSVRNADGCVTSRIAVPGAELAEGVIKRVIARDKDPGNQDFTTWLTSVFNYDQQGRVVDIEGSDNWLYSFVYNNNRLSRYLELDRSYNESYTFDMLYDSQGRVGAVSYAQNFNGSPGYMEDIRCSYDSEGRLARLESQNEGSYYLLEYDARGNLERARYFDGPDQESYRYLYTYEQSANPLALIKVFYYDFHTYLGEYFFLPMITNGQFAPDRIVKVVYQEVGTGNPFTFSSEVSYRFDNQGRLAEVIFEDENGELDSFLIEYD